jgi:hypothetical protein
MRSVLESRNAEHRKPGISTVEITSKYLHQRVVLFKYNGLNDRFKYKIALFYIKFEFLEFE